MRSLLFSPGDDRRKMERSLTSGADVVILDLEDSVALSRKEAAREETGSFVREHGRKEGVPKLYVRINPLTSGMTSADLATVLRERPDGLVLPKSSHGGDVVELIGRVDAISSELPEIVAIATETAGSLFNLGTYAEIGARLVGLAWGAEDLSADIGSIDARGADGSYTHLYKLARSLTLAGAANASCAPIDTVLVDFRDSEKLEAECRAARRDGFTAKMAIHPSQVAVINSIFSPTEEEIDHAQQIVAAFEASSETGVLSINGTMIDRPHLTRARKTLARRLP